MLPDIAAPWILWVLDSKGIRDNPYSYCRRWVWFWILKIWVEPWHAPRHPGTRLSHWYLGINIVRLSGSAKKLDVWRPKVRKMPGVWKNGFLKTDPKPWKKEKTRAPGHLLIVVFDYFGSLFWERPPWLCPGRPPCEMPGKVPGQLRRVCGCYNLP